MLIAVTSSNGIDVDTHFGKAGQFLVYERWAGVSRSLCARSRRLLTVAALRRAIA